MDSEFRWAGIGTVTGGRQDALSVCDSSVTLRCCSVPTVPNGRSFRVNLSLAKIIACCGVPRLAVFPFGLASNATTSALQSLALSAGLDGDGSVKPCVAGFVHFPHAPGSNGAENFVGTESSSGSQRHRLIGFIL